MKLNLAFTFLELLVVIAIISTLAALLFPVIGQARSRAFLIQDISQMRQVYVAVGLYDQDENDELPPSLLYVEPYAKSTAVFTSPVDPFRNGIPGIKDFPANMLDGADLRSPFRISYGYLVPAALLYGFDDAWLRQRRDDPAYGLLVISMYNEPAGISLGPCQQDVYRTQRVEHQIVMDGSYKVAYPEFGAVTAWTCGIGTCFGETPPPYPVVNPKILDCWAIPGITRGP